MKSRIGKFPFDLTEIRHYVCDDFRGNMLNGEDVNRSKLQKYINEHLEDLDCPQYFEHIDLKCKATFKESRADTVEIKNGKTCIYFGCRNKDVQVLRPIVNRFTGKNGIYTFEK